MTLPLIGDIITTTTERIYIMNKIDEVKNYANEEFKLWFDKASSGQGTKLKNYTSGDGDNIGLEGITKKILSKALDVYGLTSRSKINGDYFKDCDSDEFNQLPDDEQRMDHHVWIDGKVVIVEEDRTMIDKPFYILKRAVVNAFMELPHVKKHLSKNVKFIFSTLAVSVSNLTRNTSNKLYKYGDFITEVNFSGRPRNQTHNYFHHGYNQKELDKYVETICGVFSKYE